MVYGFIGLGNMASAILRGMAASGAFADDTLCGFNRSEGKTLALWHEIGLVPCKDAAAVTQMADVVVLAVKPQMLPDVLPLVTPEMTKDKLLVTIAAGKPTSYYEAQLQEGVGVVRVMPNINARVHAAASAVCGGKYATEEQLAIVREMFSAVGTVYDIAEPMFAAFSALGGASGAFVHIYIDALASAGVKAGFPRPLAEAIATQATLGAAQLTMESDEHPIALCDQVTSPGGTTIEGVHMLKKLGFETAVQQAVEAIIEKDKKLGE